MARRTTRISDRRPTRSRTSEGLVSSDLGRSESSDGPHDSDQRLRSATRISVVRLGVAAPKSHSSHGRRTGVSSERARVWRKITARLCMGQFQDEPDPATVRRAAALNSFQTRRSSDLGRSDGPPLGPWVVPAAATSPAAEISSAAGAAPAGPAVRVRRGRRRLKSARTPLSRPGWRSRLRQPGPGPVGCFAQ